MVEFDKSGFYMNGYLNGNMINGYLDIEMDK